MAASVIGGHEVALLDATFWSRYELPPARSAVVPHPIVPDTIARFGDLDTRVILTHLNHTNPLTDPTSEPRKG